MNFPERVRCYSLEPWRIIPIVPLSVGEGLSLYYSIFMDEIDSIGISRGDGGGDSEVKCAMLELLNQLDGFEPAQNIKFIIAMNRPGRIDREIQFPNPNAMPVEPKARQFVPKRECLLCETDVCMLRKRILKCQWPKS
jgi:26S proteasome regulatory subunit T6